MMSVKWSIRLMVAFVTNITTMATIPKREVFLPADMAKWLKSKAYHEYMGFIIAINDAVKAKHKTPYPVSENVNQIVKLLDKMESWIDEIPPLEMDQRFGNKAFRTWFERLKTNAEVLLQEALPSDLHDKIPEIAPYLVEGVGNATRIDYGSGHEMSFVMFLCCLFNIGFFQPDDQTATALTVFNKYLKVMRKLQITYRMEPAGSHGVWSLDDYQFVPFIWGSAQLIDHPKLLPKSFPDPDIAASFAKDYMFLSAIDFIHKVKTGPFAEHSNQLWNISGVPQWAKVNEGLIKMYKAEVLAKFPVVQHVLFGSIFSIEPAPQQ